MDEVRVGRHRIAYHDKGEGRPLVLLHGWPLNSREWRRQIDGLSDEFRVVAWDAPGAGRSSDPPEGFRLPDWADCLAAFIDALELGRPHVAGLSWGGGLALELYRRHPEMVRTLILLSAYAGWAGSLPAEVVDQRLGLMRRNSRLPVDEWAPALIQTLVGDGASADVVEEIRSIIAEFHPAATRVALQAFAEADLRELLVRIRVPTLLLYGEQDVRAPQHVWEPLHSRIRGSTLTLIPDVGHMVDIEAAERVNAEIRSFGARHDRPASMDVMSYPDPPPLPPGLPAPEDDGAADHLEGRRVEAVRLTASTGQEVLLGDTDRPTVLFCCPRMGQPDAPALVSDWDRIPGARGCTAEARGFRDVYAEFTAAGLDVYGVSTEERASQKVAAERLGLPFPLLSDAGLRLATAWRLPTFAVVGHTLLKRLTLLLRDGVVTAVWYPVFPPDRHALEVLDAAKRPR